MYLWLFQLLLWSKEELVYQKKISCFILLFVPVLYVCDFDHCHNLYFFLFLCNSLNTFDIGRITEWSLQFAVSPHSSYKIVTFFILYLMSNIHYLKFRFYWLLQLCALFWFISDCWCCIYIDCVSVVLNLYWKFVTLIMFTLRWRAASIQRPIEKVLLVAFVFAVNFPLAGGIIIVTNITILFFLLYLKMISIKI